MEALHFAQFNDDYSSAYIALFRGVSNAGELKKRIIAASTAKGELGEQEREAVNFAFIDARLITSKLHLQTAVYQAILAQAQDALRTKTVHSEILYYLNPTHNITEAIRRYGVSKSNSDLLIVRIASPQLSSSTVEAKMKEVVVGQITPLSELKAVTDWSTIKEYHKLNDEAAIKAVADIPAKGHLIVDNIVVSSVAMKSVMG